MKNTKLMIAGLTAAMVMSMCTVAPVFAKDNKVQAEKADNVFVSSDGILSIELPDDSWKEVQDPNKWIVLSDGENEITLRHFSNGADLPAIVTADDQYSKTITSALSTKNEVFIATGLVANTDEEDEINDSLQSIKILKYDTKLAVEEEAPAPVPAQQTSQETKKEETQEPESTADEAEAAPVETYLVYSEGSGRPVNIMENEDGVYTDEEGVEYYENDDGTFTDEYDATYQVSGMN